MRIQTPYEIVHQENYGYQCATGRVQEVDYEYFGFRKFFFGGLSLIDGIRGWNLGKFRRNFFF
jgi:hypothetical protein